MPRPLVPEDLANGAAQRRSLHRALAAVALGALGKQGTHKVLARNWPNDHMAGLITRAATSPLDRSGFPQVIAINVLPLVAPRSAASQLFEKCLRLDFAGKYSFVVPSASTVPRPSFVAEGAPIPVDQAVLATSTIGPVCKLTFLAAVTRELENAAPESASAIIGRLMAMGAARALDAAVFDTNASDASRPAGLLHNVVPLAANTGTDAGAMVRDLRALVGAVADAGVLGEIVLAAHPQRALALQLLPAGAQFPYAVLSSAQIDKDSVIAIGVDGVASGYDGLPTLDTSTAAVVHFADPALAIGTASPAMSSFQQDLILLKLRIECAWGVTQPGSVQVVTNVKW